MLYQGDSKKEIEGRYDFILHGYAEGGVDRLRLSDLPGRPEELAFSFRHFAVLNGMFQLSQPFEVERIEVELQPDGKKKKEVRKNFSWRQATADSAP